MISIRLFRICAIVAFCFLCHEIYLQNWGDYADMSQGVVVYALYASDVLLICWFGTRLTQHVRKMAFIFVVVLLLLLLLFLVLVLVVTVVNCRRRRLCRSYNITLPCE